MAMRQTDFTVTGKGGVQAFWIAVGDKDVRLVNGRGSIDLDDAKSHILTWWFAGNPGGTLSITGKVGQKTVVEVKESVIPAGEHEAAGRKRFDLKSGS
jgi:hypothetical protein